MNLVAYNGQLVTSNGNAITADISSMLPSGIGVVDGGTLNWIYLTSPSPAHFSVRYLDNADNWAICSKYPSKYYLTNKSICVQGVHYDNGFNIADSDYSDAQSFKDSMSGVLLFYRKASS